MRLGHQFFRFAVIGAVGFVVDVGVLYALRHAGLDLYSARLLSFTAAATATWLGNRGYTFAGGGKRVAALHREWLNYVMAMGIGGLTNYAVYAVLISSFNRFHSHPWMAVAAGTATAMVLNFVLARRLLYQRGD